MFMVVGFFYKFKGAKHITMITDCQCRHPISNSFFIKIFDRGSPI